MLWRLRKRTLKSIARMMPGYAVRRILLRWSGYRVGQDVFVGEELIIKDELEDRGMLSIGDRAAIADRVTFVISSNANFSRIRPIMGDVHRPIEIGNDAWIGTGAILLPGIVVGAGAVVGAGSVVTKSVPASTVVAGNPATVVRQLGLEEKQIQPNGEPDERRIA